MSNQGDAFIQLISSTNLEKYKNRSLAVISIQDESMIPVVGAALQAGSLSLPIIDSVINAGSQLAYIKMPAGMDASACFARTDGFGGFTLSAHDAAGDFINGSWVPATLSPSMVAVAGFAFAAVMIVEKELADINEKLGIIESDVKEIVEALGIRRRSEIEGLYDRILYDYVARFDEYVKDPEKLQAARVEIEGSLTDISKLWAEQKNYIKAQAEYLTETKNSKKAHLIEQIEKFNNNEHNAATVFELSCALGQVRMFYDRDVSNQRIMREEEHALRRLNEYREVHEETLMLLVERIKNYEGVPLALTSEDKVDKKSALPANAAEGAAWAAGSLIERLTKQTPWAAAAEQNNKDIDELLSRIPSVSRSSLCESVFVKAKSSLTKMSHTFEKADAMLFDGESFYLLESEISE